MLAKIITSKLQHLLDKTKGYVMTEEEKEAQRQSWVRGQIALMKEDRKNRRVIVLESPSDDDRKFNGG